MRNEINANIYTTDLTNIEKSNDAWRMGRELFYTTLNNQFALLDKEILFKFLNQAAKLQDENGYIVLFKLISYLIEQHKQYICFCSVS